MLKLIIDIGNSRTKIGIFDGNNIIYFKQIDNKNKQQILDVTKNYKIERTILSSVSKDHDSELSNIITAISNSFIILNHTTKLPFVNKYESPETLGNDRIAAVAGAQTLFPNQNALIIDAGTAITYDLFINNQYIGGNISPGINMRFKALNQFTSALPLIKPVEEKWTDIPGKNTNDAITSGVLNGTLFEIEQYRKYCQKKWGKIITIITGGETIYFVKRIKNPIFAVPNLVLIGLNRILEYNEEI